MTLLTTVIIGLTLAAYLELVSAQNLSTARSQQWNVGMAVIEAGIEEALTQLYHNPTNRDANSWSYADALYTKEREVGLDKYVVTISDTTPPEIVSRAYVRAPRSTNYMTPPRAVRVTTTNESLFARGMVAKGVIDMSGNNVRTDSFDSMDPAYSTGGVYDPDKAKDGGSVATNLGLVNSLNVGNADIHGRAAMGPGGSPALGPSGGIGPKWWRDAGNTGVYPGWFADDMNVNFPDVSAPFTGGAYTPASGNVGGTNYNYVLGTGNYQLTSLTMTGNSNNKLLVNGNAVLYVTGNVSLSGQSSIVVAPNASLKMYVGGANASLGGNGVINQNANATNFYYYGLPSNTTLGFSGNASFTGVIYAPAAAFTLGGGGSNQYDFVGASVTGSVRMNGHYNFHYDENLGRIGAFRGYVVTSWNEFTWEEL